ncbi:MAG: riboflavin biosynthesis protein RibF [Candidatus Cryptobacteroides sp.]|nr:riboflavin biosynthesis protein RibF [Candidatus Cryptobacteroides sp.]
MVVATGFFDGVHIGHRKVLGQLVEAARARGGESMVITFWPHPRTVLQKDARSLRLLSSLSEKTALIRSLGVDRVEVLDFSREFCALSCRDYLKEVVRDRFGADAILLGYDNRMGSDCCSPDQAAATAVDLGLEVIRCASIDDGGSAISSTRIRKALEEGRVDDAARMLGRPYSLHGVVVAGNRLGRSIGFPTANMQLYEPLKQLPGNGVYLVDVHTLGRDFRGMCNIGVRPTVGENRALTIETNIFGFDEDIYGLDIGLDFLARIRGERRFSSLEDLAAQLEKDKKFRL